MTRTPFVPRLRWSAGWPSPWTLVAVMLPAFVISACAASVTAPQPTPRHTDAPGAPDVVHRDDPPVAAPRPPAERPPIPPPPPERPAVAPPPAAARPAREAPRVAITLTAATAAQKASVRIDGAWTVFRTDGEPLLDGRGLKADIELKGTLVINGVQLARDMMDLVPATTGDLRIAGRRCPGRLRMTWEPQPRFQLVCDVETYLEGVLAGELPPEFGREARRAQAVVARTYLLSQPTASWTADTVAVDDTGRTDQEYAGIVGTAAQQEAVRDAIASTRGMVLFDGVAPVRAWYHSICGGHTTSSAPVFHVPATAPLRGVTCTGCVGTKYYRWNATLPGAKVVAAAKLTGALKSFRTLDTTPEGRAKTFEVRAASGTAKIGAPEFRLAVGPRDLRSVWLDKADVVNGDLVVAGRGWGHGVGMCQWGAKGMADKGATAEAIVAHYYPGAEFRRLW